MHNWAYFINIYICASSFLYVLIISTNVYYLSSYAYFSGKYCIYQKDKNCPKGLMPGNVFWNDDDDVSDNGDQQAGALPDFEFVNDAYTRIYFCCKTDGDKNNSVLLPSKSPFFLLAYNSSTCQMVKWTVVSLEWIYFSTYSSDNQDSADGAFPYDAGIKHPTMYYCYYRGKKNSIIVWKCQVT